MVTAKSLGLPYLSAYLDSLGTNFTHGANFATYASTIRLPTSIIPAGTYSPIYLDVEYSEFVQFKFRSQVIRQKGKMGQWVNTSIVLNIGYCSSWELRVLITNICITKWIFTLYWAFDFLVGGIYAYLLPKGYYFPKALYTFDIGQNDLAEGIMGNMTIEEISASFPDIVNKFSINVKVIKYILRFVIENGLPCWPWPTTSRRNIQLLNQLVKKKKEKKRQ